MLEKDIIEFLIRAKKATYASGGNIIEPLRVGSCDLKYSEKNIEYYDSYFGTNPFIGEEILRFNQKVIWSMNYIGRKIDDNFEYNFLKEALLHIEPKLPFRGPCIYQNSGYIYKAYTLGDFSWFQGQEWIEHNGKLVYQGYYHGGKIG